MVAHDALRYRLNIGFRQCAMHNSCGRLCSNESFMSMGDISIIML